MNFAKIVAKAGSAPLFSTLSAYPGRVFTINELAKISKVPFATAWRIVHDWTLAGIVDVRRVGRANAVTLRDSDLTRSLHGFFALRSPHSLSLERLKAELAREKTVLSAYVFGSVARGEEKLDSDIDLAALAKNWNPEKLVSRFHEETRLKLVPLVFTSRKEFDVFMKEKKAVKLK